jgi:predicted RNase H-like nuclease (RuvC/YqgF family)
MSGIHLGPDGKPYQSWQEAEEARIRYFEPESIANRKIWALEAEKEKLKTELEAAQNRVRLLEECIEKFKERIETDLKAAKVMSSLNSVDRKKYYLEAKKFIQELLDKINRIEKDVLKKKG